MSTRAKKVYGIDTEIKDVLTVVTVTKNGNYVYGHIINGTDRFRSRAYLTESKKDLFDEKHRDLIWYLAWSGKKCVVTEQFAKGAGVEKIYLAGKPENVQSLRLQRYEFNRSIAKAKSKPVSIKIP